ncbi:hypothetical protein FJZ19_00620 [Candidatus Pacearchaeota archaeon]|nr:hypothetical protein [Candidatus Pacearchaeota archaeon]
MEDYGFTELNEEDRRRLPCRIGDELIYFRHENAGDFGHELELHASGIARSDVVDGIAEEAQTAYRKCEPEKIKNLARRILKAIGDLKMKYQRGEGFSETAIHVNNCDGQSRTIGFNNAAPTPELGELEQELLHISLEVVRDVKREKIHPLRS